MLTEESRILGRHNDEEEIQPLLCSRSQFCFQGRVLLVVQVKPLAAFGGLANFDTLLSQ